MAPKSIWFKATSQLPHLSFSLCMCVCGCVAEHLECVVMSAWPSQRIVHPLTVSQLVYSLNCFSVQTTQSLTIIKLAHPNEDPIYSVLTNLFMAHLNSLLYLKIFSIVQVNYFLYPTLHSAMEALPLLSAAMNPRIFSCLSITV